MSDISKEAVKRYRPAVHTDGAACMVDCNIGFWVSKPDYDALAAKLAEVEAEKLAIAQRFDEFHPDPALMSRIIMTSIERDCQNQELTAKLQAAATALTAARAALVIAREEALEEAATFVEAHVYTTNGGERSMQPASHKFRGMDRHHATIAAAIRDIATPQEKADE